MYNPSSEHVARAREYIQALHEYKNQRSLFGFPDGVFLSYSDIYTNDLRAERTCVISNEQTASSVIPGATQILAFESGKKVGLEHESRSSGCADIVLFHVNQKGSMLFIGDGVNIVGAPHPLVVKLMEEYGVLRPDMLPAAIIRKKSAEGNFFVANITDLDGITYTKRVLTIYNNLLSEEYQRVGIIGKAFPGSLQKKYPLYVDSISQVPCIVGTAVWFDRFQERVSFTSIGDPRMYVLLQDGSLQPANPIQNVGFDQLTSQYIKWKLQMNPDLSLERLLQSDEFVRWIQQMYEKK